MSNIQGPESWKLVKHPTQAGYILVQGENLQPVMYAQEAAGTGDRAVPNRMLLEAAPALLAALIDLRNSGSGKYVFACAMPPSPRQPEKRRNGRPGNFSFSRFQTLRPRSESFFCATHGPARWVRNSLGV